MINYQLLSSECSRGDVKGATVSNGAVLRVDWEGRRNAVMLILVVWLTWSHGKGGEKKKEQRKASTKKKEESRKDTDMD